MDYNTHRANISSAGQGLCNFQVNIFIFDQVIRVLRINCLRARAEREQREREDMDYKTHLARISSAGQGLCNKFVKINSLVEVERRGKRDRVE